MKEALNDFANGYGFPLITGIGKLGLLGLVIEPGNMDLIDKYLFAGLAVDGAETVFRAAFKPYSEAAFSCAERHLFYDAPKFLVRAGNMAGDIIPEIYTNTKDLLGAFWDGLRDR